MAKVKHPFTSPRFANRVMREFDFERFKDLGLKSRIVLYTAYETHGNCFSVIYDGKILTEAETYDGKHISWKAILPMPVYRKEGLIQLSLSEALKNGGIPEEILFKKPSRLEFFISADPDDYSGLYAFRDQIIPRLFEDGGDQYNPDHSSVSWLYVGKDKLTSVLYTQADKLTISQTEVGGVKIFTERDIDRLKRLTSNDC